MTFTLPASTAEAERLIDAQAAKVGRRCGECSLCCRLLDVPEAGKPLGGWCPHARPGKGGCVIYERRPLPCRGYACMWLMGKLPEHWFPASAHMIVDMQVQEVETPFLRVLVDPDYPNQWREEPYYSQIKQLARRGATGELGTKFNGVIAVGNEPWLKMLMRRQPGHRRMRKACQPRTRIETARSIGSNKAGSSRYARSVSNSASAEIECVKFACAKGKRDIMLIDVRHDREFQRFLDRREQRLHVEIAPVLARGIMLQMSRG